MLLSSMDDTGLPTSEAVHVEQSVEVVREEKEESTEADWQEGAADLSEVGEEAAAAAGSSLLPRQILDKLTSKLSAVEICRRGGGDEASASCSSGLRFTSARVTSMDSSDG